METSEYWSREISNTPIVRATMDATALALQSGGVANVHSRGVARDANIALSTVFHHFGSMKGLVFHTLLDGFSRAPGKLQGLAQIPAQYQLSWLFAQHGLILESDLSVSVALQFDDWWYFSPDAVARLRLERLRYISKWVDPIRECVQPELTERQLSIAAEFISQSVGFFRSNIAISGGYSVDEVVDTLRDLFCSTRG